MIEGYLPTSIPPKNEPDVGAYLAARLAFTWVRRTGDDEGYLLEEWHDHCDAPHGKAA